MGSKEILAAGNELRQKVLELEEVFDITLREEDKYTSLIPYCRNLLVSFGFRLAPALTSDYNNITKLDDLVDYFYNRFKYLNPNKIVPSKKISRDRGIAKRFIEARINASGVSRKEAIAECAEIIETVLRNSRSFELVFVIGFRMFGQEDMLWVTERAVGMMNDKRVHEIPEYTEHLIEKANETYEGPRGILHLLEEEEEDGEKERR